MNGAIIAVWPVTLLLAAAVAGVPLWMTVRHRHAAPEYDEARAHYRAKQATPSEAPSSDFVPTQPVAAVDGLTIVHKTGTADDDVVVPAQRHW
jgi:hypothetical protein